MKQMKSLLKVGAIVLFAALTVSSCKKNEDPYAGYTQEREDGLIKDWVTAMVEKNLNVDTTANGILYIIDTAGTGDLVKTGDTLTVKYTGYFMDGTVFDASAYRGDGTMTYVHKDSNPDNRMITGWEEGIEKLSKGSIGVFCIPSAKAYGPYGYSSIPPYSPLIFVIEVLDIK
ncbi:MAG: FKBP-type peptidyl-prolyl cis-trans isomerase [Prolixibacteraceae bacterium]